MALVRLPDIIAVSRPAGLPFIPLEMEFVNYPNGTAAAGVLYWAASPAVHAVVTMIEDRDLARWACRALNDAVMHPVTGAPSAPRPANAAVAAILAPIDSFTTRAWACNALNRASLALDLAA